MPVVVAALGPLMLKIAGELADGTNTWMVGPNTMESHIIANLTKAAAAAGRPDPKVVGGYPIVLTNKPDEAREKINEQLAIYGQLPSYRAMLDLEGAANPADIAIVGDENALRGELLRLENMGVTDFNAAIVDVEDGAYDRTLEFLASMKG
jgi:alkanesulfonate monooxygenase SsuD/methylene tetrahydromethanopterin reductase-like flavin-dependent oxidoreductase (luciferase family)